MTDERFSDIGSLPLRPLEDPPVRESDSRVRGLDLRLANPESPALRRGGLWPIAVALVTGLLIGYVAGHGFRPAASNSVAVEPSIQTTSAAPPVTGAEWSERTIDEPSDGSKSDATKGEAPAAPRSIAPRPARVLRPVPARAESDRTPHLQGARSLFVDSRPSGADVYLNNKRVGQTPLSLSNVPAGPGVVRLERSGYRRWSSSVRLETGQHARVTASLERASTE
jgi:PEGA domain